MIWNNDTQCYRGETADGKIVEVTGDEWAESLADGIKAEIENNEPDFQGDVEAFRESYPSRYDNYENQAWSEINDVEMWYGCVGVNQNVEIVEK